MRTAFNADQGGTTDEGFRAELASSNPTRALDKTKLPALQLGRIPGGGIRFARRAAETARAACRAMQELLAAVLLVWQTSNRRALSPVVTIRPELQERLLN